MRLTKKATLIIISVLGIGMIVCMILVHLYFPTWLKGKLIAYVEEEGTYDMEIAHLSLQGYNTVILKGVRIKPVLEPAAFNKKNGYQKDWISTSIQQISLRGIDWSMLLSDKKLLVEKISIEVPEVYVYRDKRFPDPHKPKSLPSHYLRSNKLFNFIFPLIELKNGQVVYEESPEKGGTIKVNFNKLNASFYHVSSDSLYMIKEPVITIDAEAMILDSVKTKITYKANTLHKNDRFTMEGELSSFSAKLLNQCIPSSLNAEITSGFMKHIRFRFEADNDQAKGRMDMDYRDLKLKVLKKDEEKKSGLKTWIANIFVRNKDKEKKEAGDPYTGEISFKRRKDRFIFNYWWNAFKSGVTSTVVKKPDE